VRAAYETRRKAMEQDDAGSERRRIAHIYIDPASVGGFEAARDKLQDVKQAIEAGELDFATAARDYSEDSASANSAGQLGLLSKQDLPDSLSQVAFSLAQDEISEPVRSDDGYHLLLVEHIQSKRTSFASFEEMQDTLREELFKIKAESVLFDKVGQLEELAFEHPDLEMPAEVLGLELKTSKPFSLQAPFEPFTNPDAVDELMAPEVRDGSHNSRLVEVGEDSYFVFHVKEVIPAKPIPIKEVTDNIRKKIAHEQAVSLLAEQKQELEVALQEGKPFEELLVILDTEKKDILGLQRDSSEPITNFAFSVQKTADGNPMIGVRQLNNGDLALVKITDVRDGETQLEAEEQQQTLAILARMEGQYMEQLLTEALRERGKVKRYSERFERLQSRG